MSDLFENTHKDWSVTDAKSVKYDASQIKQLEGLEAVRYRPGMYIGGVDSRALHHMAAEIIDNAMDEVMSGFATRIEVEFMADGSLSVCDNGRGIPVDMHESGKSALEVIFTSLHSGSKFGGKVYKTPGGLHGVGSSVVNALSETLVVEVARDKYLWRQQYKCGKPLGPVENVGAVSNRRGTKVVFLPDRQIFADTVFNPKYLYKMVREKAYLFKGVTLRWHCAPCNLVKDTDIPTADEFHFSKGLEEYLAAVISTRATVVPRSFAGDIEGDLGRAQWCIHWAVDGDSFVHTYCNTIPTPQGGTHDNAFRNALCKGLRNYGTLIGEKKSIGLTADDICGEASYLLSVFIHEPQFQSQTKDRLSSPTATKLVEGVVRDRFEQWLAEDPQSANILLQYVIERMEERNMRRTVKEARRKTATRKHRLPGKLADCCKKSSEDTELFLVEGDSAGGSAKQARNRKLQAILPLKGKILNVASSPRDKIDANQEIKDIVQALGCGTRQDFDIDKLRYDRIIIMTDADVDGAHISTLLMTFFYREMPDLIERGRLFLAMPPLYKVSSQGKSFYARDDDHKNQLIAQQFSKNAKIDISRFKGLGEMSPNQLKATTMDIKTRSLVQVDIDDFMAEKDCVDSKDTSSLVESLMGRKPERRFDFIQRNAKFVTHIDV